MRLSRRALLATLAVAGTAGLVGGGAVAARQARSFAPGILQSTADEPAAARVLLFTRTTGFRHDSIPDAVQAILGAAPGLGLAADQTEDPTVFTPEGLAPYAAVVFLLTTGDVLDASQQAAFEQFIQAGRGYAGVHSASDTAYEWPWYRGLVGAYFKSHPQVQTATIHVETADHPSTWFLPAAWERTDEWYSFRTNPRDAGVQVLATLDESTYQGGEMGSDHPIAWAHAYDGGRAWYTAGGHTSESYAEPLFLAHVMGGIAYAADVPFAPGPALA